MKIDRANTYISVGLAIVIVGAVAVGGFAWGQMDTRVEQLEQQQDEQGDVEQLVQQIDKRQTEIKTKQDERVKAQEKFEDSVTKALDRIIRKLDE